MLTSTVSVRRIGEPLSRGCRRPSGRRGRILALAAVLAVAAGAPLFTPLFTGAGARAQTQQPLPPELQQPLPVQPGQVPGQQQQQQPVPPQPQQQQPAPQAQPGADADADQRHGDWQERCTPEPPPGASPPPPGKDVACFLIQTVSDLDTRRPLLKITIGFFGPERRVAAVIAIPLGVQLMRGLEVSVDGKTIDTVPFQVCEPSGCQAVLPMDPPVVDAFKAGNQAEARVEVRGREHGLPISLKGFTAGFNAIQ